MTKADLIAVIAEKLKFPLARAELLVDVVFDCLEQSMSRGEKIEIRATHPNYPYSQARNSTLLTIGSPVRGGGAGLARRTGLLRIHVSIPARNNRPIFAGVVVDLIKRAPGHQRRTQCAEGIFARNAGSGRRAIIGIDGIPEAAR
jgi:hypothetical protein